MQQNKSDIFETAHHEWSGVTMTARAAAQIIKLMKTNEKIKGLKLSIKPSGCAGFSYVMNMIESTTNDDLLFEQKEAKLYVPLKAMPFVDGTEMDYVSEGLNHMFKFNNPRAQHACGCGESFGV
ncbi:Fe-S cluster assembly scaffold SufA [Candidatus Williamhamiltonella defendens]|uniref:Fe-S cluster assembly scaffold SufA n=1 Tax=Candidatus Williamhamiltonella defendens TaxID=138072 RepID=UPI00130EE3A3|nr:Fe-S cluster assembly scaffold SufA [Candidatus Hamiltonella defensa]